MLGDQGECAKRIKRERRNGQLTVRQRDMTMIRSQEKHATRLDVRLQKRIRKRASRKQRYFVAFLASFASPGIMQDTL
jgi:hypothetical protein